MGWGYLLRCFWNQVAERDQHICCRMLKIIENMANLNHFCMQALSRFNTSVRNEHRAVEIDVYQRCRLQQQTLHTQNIHQSWLYQSCRDSISPDFLSSNFISHYFISRNSISYDLWLNMSRLHQLLLISRNSISHDLTCHVTSIPHDTVSHNSISHASNHQTPNHSPTCYRCKVLTTVKYIKWFCHSVY